MGVKKKEEKKQEDTIDLSTLPPCKTMCVSLNWHTYLGSLIKHLKIADYKPISREDLMATLKEKSLESTPKNLAQICKSKIDEIQLPIRKEKKDQSKKEEQEKFDLLILLKGYPVSYEEALELDQADIIIEIFLYMRPTLSHQNIHFKRKLEQYHQKTQEIINAGGDPQSIIQPVIPELYPQSLYALDKFSIEKDNYKQLLIKVREFESDEDLEFKEEVKEEKEETKKKDVKPSPRKGEEPKEEEIDQNDPKIKFCASFTDEVKNIVNQRLVYENWKKAIKLQPLFPDSSGLHPSTSQVSLASSDKKSESHEKITSKDDLPKTWDFSYYFSSIKNLPEEICNFQVIVSCILRWICRECAGSSLFMPSNPSTNLMNILSQNNLNQLKAVDLKFYMSESYVTETLEKILESLNIPGVKRYILPESISIQERNAETTSILSFSSFSSRFFERSLSLMTFENMLKRVQGERTWNFGNRIYEEKLSIKDFYQIYLKITEFDPEILTEYVPRTDSLLLCVYFKTPPGRIIHKAWKTPWKVCPNFSQYASIFKDKQSSEFYDIDPNRVGIIKERCKIMYPADNSVIKMIEYHIGSRKTKYHEQILRPRYRPIVYKDGWYFGIRKKQKKNEFWANFIDEKILVEMSDNGLELNFTSENGLIVKILPGGEILQQKHNSDEENRIIFTNGSIGKYYKDGTIQMLMPSGEVSQFAKEKFWIITNNKGRRVAKRQKLIYPMEPITVTSQIDAETLALVTIREDLVMTLKFQDNSFAVFHEDGSRIYKSSDNNTIYIESPGYAPVKIYKDPIKARQNTIIGLGSSDSGLGTEDIMLRSNDGVLIETFLPNKTKIQSFVQKQELEAYNEFATNRINLVTRNDGTIFKTSQDGEIVFITTEARESLAKVSGSSAYFYDIFTVPEERNSGVYTIRADTGKIWTKDNEGNYFEVTTTGKAIERLAVSLNVEDNQPDSPPLSEGEYIDPECKFLPPPATIISPRIFIIKDDAITELLEESQLEYYFKNCQGRYIKEDTKEYISHTWISDKNVNENYTFPGSPFVKYSLPKLVSPMLQTLVLSDKPKLVNYIFRRVKEFPLIDEEKRIKIEQELQNFEDWKKEKEKAEKSYIINDPRNDLETNKYEKFLQRLIKFRGLEEPKVEKTDNDQMSEFIVQLSEDEIETSIPMIPIQIPERKISNFKMETL